MDGILARLREDAAAAAWLDALDGLDSSSTGLDSPGTGFEADELAELLLDLTVPHEDVTPLLAAGRTLLADPEWRRLVARCAAGFLADPRTVGGGFGPPRLPEGFGAPGRCLPVFAFLAALPRARAHHRELGVPAEVSRRTFADLGRQLTVHRLRYGTTGLDTPGWLRLHLRGELFQLGRLQFQRSRLAADWLPTAGAPSLSLHIPDFLGPLTPAACEDSLARARAFFPRHFPAEPHTVVHCESWLLDRQLAEHLAAGSNILAFQRRFHPAAPPTDPEDATPVRYVFGRADLPPAELPRRTALERAVGDHLRAGGHWYGGRGWFALEDVARGR